MTSKIIQIEVMKDNMDDYNVCMYALCEDGTIWWRYAHQEEYNNNWTQISTPILEK